MCLRGMRGPLAGGLCDEEAGAAQVGRRSDDQTGEENDVCVERGQRTQECVDCNCQLRDIKGRELFLCQSCLSGRSCPLWRHWLFSWAALSSPGKH